MDKVLTAYEVLRAVGEPDAYGGNPPGWAEAQAAKPGGAGPWRDPAARSARRAAAGFPAERDPLLAAMAGILDSDPALDSLAWYLHWRTFVVPERGEGWDAPPLERRLGAQAGIFFLLLALAFPERLAVWHRRLGYLPGVTADTLRQLACFETYHLQARGVPGLFNGHFAWLAKYLAMPYVRLGRFEYQLHPYGGGVSVWRRSADGLVLALAEAGARVDAAGLITGPGAPTGDDWIAGLEETPEAVTGYPVDPAGFIRREPVRLDRSAWAPCLAQGSTVLDLHIPPGGGMGWEDLTASFSQALDFFARRHADRPFAALVVNTWFMDPRLADLLTADSNLLRFQRAVHLYPVPANPGSLWFVFLRDMTTADPAALPRDTSLRRALAAFLAAGGRWHGGGMFILPEDMRAPREGVYRERFQALRVEWGSFDPRRQGRPTA